MPHALERSPSTIADQACLCLCVGRSRCAHVRAPGLVCCSHVRAPTPPGTVDGVSLAQMSIACLGVTFPIETWAAALDEQYRSALEFRDGLKPRRPRGSAGDDGGGGRRFARARGRTVDREGGKADWRLRLSTQNEPSEFWSQVRRTCDVVRRTSRACSRRGAASGAMQASARASASCASAAASTPRHPPAPLLESIASVVSTSCDGGLAGLSSSSSAPASAAASAAASEVPPTEVSPSPPPSPPGSGGVGQPPSRFRLSLHKLPGLRRRPQPPGGAEGLSTTPTADRATSSEEQQAEATSPLGTLGVPRVPRGSAACTALPPPPIGSTRDADESLRGGSGRRTQDTDASGRHTCTEGGADGGGGGGAPAPSSRRTSGVVRRLSDIVVARRPVKLSTSVALDVRPGEALVGGEGSVVPPPVESPIRMSIASRAQVGADPHRSLPVHHPLSTPHAAPFARLHLTRAAPPSLLHHPSSLPCAGLAERHHVQLLEQPVDLEHELALVAPPPDDELRRRGAVDVCAQRRRRRRRRRRRVCRADVDPPKAVLSAFRP